MSYKIAINEFHYKRNDQHHVVGAVSMAVHYYQLHVGYHVVDAVVVVAVVVVGQPVGSISSKTLAYDCLYALELCTASMIATS